MKSKFSWAKEGDADSKLFHRLMNARKSKNSITRIKLEDRSVVDREEEIVQAVRDLGRIKQSQEFENLVFSLDHSSTIHYSKR
ncbi:hypothetical protein PanWU01x14_127100 [Parasponia andersonii]|uniref:Uncharacterized protein n=1 Tax=Parasponia andersonii TaxID=3476 RepID=A0A2P5CT03_PARAD|nr:hypothetical protein PanWU01x14_127100 [Parasponia andersonii]